jgi:hypothetical protein
MAKHAGNQMHYIARSVLQFLIGTDAIEEDFALLNMGNMMIQVQQTLIKQIFFSWERIPTSNSVGINNDHVKNSFTTLLRLINQ